MFALKIFTTISLAVLAFGMAGCTVSRKNAAKIRIIALYIVFLQMLAIAFMWQ